MENDNIKKRTEEVINFISYRETNDFRYDYVKAFLIELIPFRNTNDLYSEMALFNQKYGKNITQYSDLIIYICREVFPQYDSSWIKDFLNMYRINNFSFSKDGSWLLGKNVKYKEEEIPLYEEKLKDIPEEIKDEFEKAISLNVIDHHWTEHINTLSHLREGIYLRGYGQEDPLRAYTMEGFDLFDKMMQRIDNDITLMLVRSEIRQNIERKEVSKKQITNDSDETIKKQPKKSEKIGRNDPCPCGSGKKYKQCCGK